MKISIERIGKITQASIELSGLTVIAGENDTGKSTVGRVAYAIVQAYSAFPLILKNDKISSIRRLLDAIYFDIRKITDLNDKPEIRKFFSALRLQTADFENIPLAFIEGVLNSVEATGPERIKESSARSIAMVRARLERLRDQLRPDPDEDLAVAGYLHKALHAEFAGEIQQCGQALAARIILEDGATTVLDVQFDDAAVLAFKGGDPLEFRDATLVDGPAILQFYPAIVGSALPYAARSFKDALPYHLFDLAKKLGARHNARPQLSGMNNVEAITAGNIRYNEEQDSFSYERNGITVPAVNMASGIKALSIVDLLGRGDYINTDTLLVLDEPETNLHPTWQIAYAKAICELARQGVTLLVTTHSPYMLEALKIYSSDLIEAKFYLAENRRGEVEFFDSLGDISPIIAALSQPLVNLLEGSSEHGF